MAYTYNRNQKNQEHAYKRMQKALSDNTLENILKFHGQERYLIRWAIAEIKKRYLNPAVEMFDFTVLDGRICGAEEIRTACETMPMLSEKRVVLLEHCDTSADYMDELIDYMSDFPETTVLITLMREKKKDSKGGAKGGSDESGKGNDKEGEGKGGKDRTRPFNAAIKKYGADYEFGRVSAEDFKRFIRKYLKASKREFNESTVEYILVASGYQDKDSAYTIENIKNDIAKIGAYGDGAVTMKEIDDCVLGNQVRNIFDFTDAVMSGRKEKALRLLSDMLASGDEEFKLLAMICSQFEALLLVSEMSDEGMSADRMAAESGMNAWRIENKLLPQARRYSTSRLRNTLMKAYEIDRNTKLGILETRLALELFVARV